MNLTDIRKVLGLPPTTNDTSESADDAKSRTRRKSMENMDLLKVAPLSHPFVVSPLPPAPCMAWDHGWSLSSYFYHFLFIDQWFWMVAGPLHALIAGMSKFKSLEAQNL